MKSKCPLVLLSFPLSHAFYESVDLELIIICSSAKHHSNRVGAICVYVLCYRHIFVLVFFDLSLCSLLVPSVRKLCDPFACGSEDARHETPTITSLSNFPSVKLYPLYAPSVSRAMVQ